MVKNKPGMTKEQIDEGAVLMRAYGNNTEILIDREREAKSHGLLAERGLATPLLARFENGLLYKFIQGGVCTPHDLTRKPVWRGVARRLGQWHGSLPILSVPNGRPLTNGMNGNACNGDVTHNADSLRFRPSKSLAARSPT